MKSELHIYMTTVTQHRRNELRNKMTTAMMNLQNVTVSVVINLCKLAKGM